ncbi:hypothetical protein ARMGADRAFT_1036647 [Armillaria gallica]|uniref:Uncharacterized protein n=1 Tax=Armillaria gallica TaxID=47427 RepID=A0A2H3CQ21_ARMGA|nr:hypothetical protein ARMGADRAFT_1036647 [Armillaria gallica]
MSIFEQEVERGSLLAERRETRMAVESESRTCSQFLGAESPPRACFYSSSSFSSGLFPRSNVILNGLDYKLQDGHLKIPRQPFSPPQLAPVYSARTLGFTPSWQLHDIFDGFYHQQLQGSTLLPFTATFPLRFYQPSYLSRSKSVQKNVQNESAGVRNGVYVYARA